ncbi:ABC transporter substrate-binding protein [uncultured Megasphaera sp.]|uniref:ABC transporter substrate-binding protein n=1 Tax=uncultured Megasphaera sp. TaxID=165188 RepID=UPI00265A7F30|nr:ABC transporter substrate-binding protein [uncultured Megasphaera sp.]
MHRYKLIAAVLALLLLIGSAGFYKYDQSYRAASADVQTIKIAYLPITHSISLFKTKELLESQGKVHVELVKYGGWSELMDALNTGRVDGAAVLIEMAMKSREQGLPLQLVALGHHDGNVVITSNAITEPSQLRGKTFAIPSPQSSHNILVQQLLANNGLTPDDVTIVEMAPAEMPAALKSGQIDGYCVAEPFGAKAVEAGIGHVFATSQDLWKDSICCGLVFNTEATAQKQEAVQAFEKAFREAGHTLTKEEAVNIAHTYLNQNEQVSRLSMEWISFDHLDVTPEAYQNLTDKMKQFHLTQNPPSYADFVKP